MTSPTPTPPLKQVVAAHGGELAALHRLLEQAGRDTIKLWKPWGRAPKGTAMSSTTRDRLLELAEDDEELACSGVTIRSCGEDWVRVWFPEPKWLVPLRTRPKVIPVEEEEGLFDDLFGAPRGTPALLWRWNVSDNCLASFTMARVLNLGDILEFQVLEEIPITPDLATLAPVRPVLLGTGNDDDDLPDVVGRWDNEKPLSEDETTDETRKDGPDDERGSSVGEDGN